MACCGRNPLSSPSSPHLLGAANGVTVRVVMTVSAFGHPKGTTGWFTGDGVQARVDAGVMRVAS